MINKYLLISLLISIFSACIYIFYPFDTKWDNITLGSSLPLSGINKELGQEVIEGANTHFRHINENGGIKNKLIILKYYDDKYEPQITIRNTYKFIDEDNVFALFGFVGTPTTKQILPIIGDIPFIAPFTGASFLRNPNVSNVVNFRRSYDEEIDNIVHYLHNNKSISRFAIFYQNDDYGIAGYNATINSLQKRGLNLVGEGTYKRNTLSINHALYEIQATNPEAIIIVGAYKPSARFIRRWRDKYDKDTLFTPISFVNANALIEDLSNNGENIYFSLTVPSYDSDTLKIADKYKSLLSKYYPNSKPSYASFESFLAANAVTLALENIQGDITQNKFLSQLKNLKSDSMGQIPISYHNSQLLNRVYLSTYQYGKFKPVIQVEP